MERLKLLFAVVAVALAGCASLNPLNPPAPNVTPPAPAPVSDTISMSTVQAHVQNAIDIATAANDQPGVVCWSTVKTWVGTLPIPTDVAVTLPPATGPAGVIETARVKRIAFDNKVTALKTILAAGLPQNVKDACAIYANDVAGIAANVLGAAGLGKLVGL